MSTQSHSDSGNNSYGEEIAARFTGADEKKWVSVKWAHTNFSKYNTEQN